MTDVESGGRGVTVTIKYGKDFSDSWAVFRGYPAEVKADLVTFFGLDETDDLSLHEVTLKATEVAHAAGAAARSLGGRVIRPGGAQSRAAAPAAAAEPEPEADPKAVILAALEAAQDVAAVKRVWAENRTLMADPDLDAAYKARGKALKEAAG